ncbi:MAG: hypothetical protein Q9209_007068 [Squamulea sp. 1 TL-2023]
MARSESGTGSFYASEYPMMQPSTTSYSDTSHRSSSVNGHQFSSVTSRHSHPSIATGYNYGSMNDEMFEHYTQTPNYMLPAQDPQASTAGYPMHEMPRQWTPITNTRPSTLSFEHDPSYRFGPSNFPYINSSSTAATGPHDSLFPEMHSLSKGLPHHRDRILPNPKRMPTALEAGSNSYQNSGEFSSYGPSPGLSHKSSVAWSPRTQTHGGSTGSVSSTSLSAFSGSVSGSVSGPVGSVTSSPPTESSNTTTTTTPFGYVPLSSSPIHQAASVSRPSEPEAVTKKASKYRSLAQMPYSLSQTSLAYRGPSIASSYSYSMGSSQPSTMTETSPSNHNLVNGEPYRHLRQPLVQHNGLDPLPIDKPLAPVASKGATATTAQSRQR